jgi:hypothetical protein
VEIAPQTLASPSSIQQWTPLTVVFKKVKDVTLLKKAVLRKQEEQYKDLAIIQSGGFMKQA